MRRPAEIKQNTNEKLHIIITESLIKLDFFSVCHHCSEGQGSECEREGCVGVYEQSERLTKRNSMGEKNMEKRAGYSDA